MKLCVHLIACTYIVIIIIIHYLFCTIPQSGRTALHHAALHGNGTVLNLLLKVPSCPINDQDQVCNEREERIRCTVMYVVFYNGILL